VALYLRMVLRARILPGKVSHFMIDSRTVAEISGTATVVGLALSRHMPAPKEGSVLYRWLFDTTQDLAKNNDRIGEVRTPTQPIPNQQAR
jgi:hypothetical protein